MLELLITYTEPHCGWTLYKVELRRKGYPDSLRLNRILFKEMFGIALPKEYCIKEMDSIQERMMSEHSIELSHNDAMDIS